MTDYFLSAGRRVTMIAALKQLGMPGKMATKFASLPDNIISVDIRLAAHCRQAIMYKNNPERHGEITPTFLMAVTIIITAIIAEARERGIAEKDMPISYQVMYESLYADQQNTTIQ
jgi:hypothetical protein